MNDELKTYKQAVWDFILEHCDITDEGSHFVKFHIKNRRNFENRVKARWKYDYHRKDTRMNMTNDEKELEALRRREEAMRKKIAKAERVNRNRKRGSIMNKIQNSNWITKHYYKYLLKKL